MEPPKNEPETPTKKYKYTLVFQYAAREGKPITGGKFEVFWGGKSVGVITPTDYEIHTHEIEVDVTSGKNNLKFKGLGGSLDYGTSIGNVKLVLNKGSDKEKVIPIKNGDFSDPNVGKGKKIGNIPGWSGILELGHGSNYNSKWPDIQVIELNAKGESGKTFKFDDTGKWVEKQDEAEPEPPKKKYTYTLIFQYAARNGKPLGDSKFEVFWGGKSIGVIEPADYDVHTHEVIVEVTKGKNNLKFKGLGGSD